MVHRRFRRMRMTVVLSAAVATLAWQAPRVNAGVSEEDVPSTSIVPAEGPNGAPANGAPSPAGTAPEPHAEGAATTSPAKPKSTVHHAPGRSVHEPEIEPAQARLKVLRVSPVYAAPAKTSRQIEQLTPEMFVEVTGSTHYYLQVKLKSGQTGYIDPSAVELVKPVDKVFTLTHDAGVFEKPNRWSNKINTVHQGHNVHVIGISLNYMQIRMKSGLEGFITTSALE